MVNVYFSSLKNKSYLSPLDKIKRLLDKCDISKQFSKEELIAIKVHFGELGNTAFIKPIYLRPVIETLKALKTKPYLVDTNTLYVGMRTNSVDHLHNAMLNGFNYSTLQTPIIIADGLRGENSIEIEINKNIFKKVKLATDIVNADGMVMISHFKGHEISGFGGALKNLSMGCASRGGKLEMHSHSRPKVTAKKCNRCGKCIINCQVGAIEMKEKAYITEKCVGCSRCIAVCPEQAIKINWNESSENTQKKIVEYAYGTTKALKSRIIYINILTEISPACDCYPGNDKPIVGDIGFLASVDPVAIDKASYDLVCRKVGKDPFKNIYPEVNTTLQLEYSGQISFGNLEYKLVEIE